MTTRKQPPKAKKASGVNVENWQRKTHQILLRLQPAVAVELRRQANACEMAIADYVSALVRGTMTCTDHQEKNPMGYLEWHAMADRLHKRGVRQRQCSECRRWYFPCELATERHSVAEGEKR